MSVEVHITEITEVVSIAIQEATGAPLSNAPALALGVAAAGTAANVSRADHVHPLPTAAQVGADAAGSAAAAQAHAVQREYHTGQQSASTISDFSEAARDAAPVQSVNSKQGNVSLTAADVGATTLKDVDLRPLTFLRPMESYLLRRRNDYFFRGSTTSGDVGEWGWETTMGAGASISYGSQLAMPTGRGINLATGATSGTTIALHKPIATAVERLSGVSYYVETGFPSYSNCAINDSAVWVGWSNGTPSGVVLVGWDTAIGPNFLIRMKGDLDAVETRIDTGVPVPTNATYWLPHMAIDIIGNFFNDNVLGSSAGFRFVISANTSSIGIIKLYDAVIPAVNAIFGSGLHVEFTNRIAADKMVSISGVEVFHGSGFYASQH